MISKERERGITFGMEKNIIALIFSLLISSRKKQVNIRYQFLKIVTQLIATLSNYCDFFRECLKCFTIT